MSAPALTSTDLPAGRGTVHVVEGGDPLGEALVFLHGWPESWRAWEDVMRAAIADGYRAIAVDLPGIGRSVRSPTDGTKRSVCSVIRDVIEALNLEQPTVIGHDCGGMIAYCYLRAHHDELARAVIMDVVIPGLEPWDAVPRNPAIWHCGFHAVPVVPEQLLRGQEDRYFDSVWDTISANPNAITPERRAAHVAAYSSPAALTAGFDWYRAFPLDARHNAPNGHTNRVRTPLLYLRGEHEGGDMDAYVSGFHAAGIERVEDARVPGSGHFAPEENPAGTWNLIRDFARRT